MVIVIASHLSKSVNHQGWEELKVCSSSILFGGMPPPSPGAPGPAGVLPPCGLQASEVQGPGAPPEREAASQVPTGLVS